MATPAGTDYPWREPSKPVARGAFIVIEGLDRAGKTTQVKKLCDALYDAGHNIQTIRFPGSSPLHPAQLWSCPGLFSTAHADSRFQTGQLQSEK
jgi:dTMP kinase